VSGFLLQASPEVSTGALSRVAELGSTWNTTRYQGGFYVDGALRSVFGDVLGLELADTVYTSISLLIVTVLVFGFLNLFALWAVWAERKVSAFMQCRLGPMEVGPYGLLQTIADGIKLTVKEDLVPRLVDKPLFVLGPIIVFAGTLVRFVPLPFGEHLTASDMDLGLFFLAAVGTIEVLGVIMAGWSSNNKWSVLGTIRTATQMVSYEIPIGLTFVTVILCYGSFSLVDIIGLQGGQLYDADGNAVSGWFWHWTIFRNPFFPILGIVYLIASLAECKRAPFDLPEAESELVSGFHTEYSGIRFALFFLAEYGAMYIVSAIAVCLFFGGWWTGIHPIDVLGSAPDASPALAILGFFIKAGTLIGKSLFLVLVQMWVRWTLPRVRLDQMMYVCWKVLLPVGLACLLGTCLWELVFGGRAFFGLLPGGRALL
jgi:NADH-quinone oxidoreductase subunit H